MRNSTAAVRLQRGDLAGEGLPTPDRQVDVRSLLVGLTHKTCAAQTCATGDVAMTERHYSEAADLFKQAAALVPEGRSDERAGHLNRQADALYREGDEFGDNTALINSIAICMERTDPANHPRLRAAPLGEDADEPRHRAPGAGGARDRDGAAGAGGHGF